MPLQQLRFELEKMATKRSKVGHFFKPARKNWQSMDYIYIKFHCYFSYPKFGPSHFSISSTLIPFRFA
jgi:hypothetical protein